MDHSRSREIEDIINGVRAAMHAGAAKSYPSVEHTALLILALQTMCRILTELLGDTNKWWSVKRDDGLNTYALLYEPLDPALVEEASKNTDPEFWASPAVERYYWPLHVRLMLAGDASLDAHKHPGDFLAMGFRMSTVAKIGRRMLAVLDQVLACSPTAQDNTTIKALRIKLAAFLREPLISEPHENYDPDQLNSRLLLHARFAGSVSHLHPDAASEFHAVMAKVGAAHGTTVQNIVEMAAVRAGLVADAAFRTDGMSAVNTGFEDCGLMLMSQLPRLQLLLGTLAWLEHRVNDERTYDLATAKTKGAKTKLHQMADTSVDPQDFAN
jgi:hypothetical protein